MFKDIFNARYILSAKRWPWIDYTRGICIILVCYRHCFEGIKESGLPIHDYPVLEILNVCFYSFRMPLFFIVSGLFVSHSLAKKTLGNYVGNRFKIIFYPLLVWGSIQITLQLLMKDYVNAKPVPFDYINLIIYPRNPSNNQQFWYLNALFFVGAFYAIFKVVLKFKIWHQLILSIVFFSIAGFLEYNGIAFYIFPDIFHFYIYFCIGDMISAFIFNRQNDAVITSRKWLLPSVILFVITQSLFTIINIQHNEDNFVDHRIPYLFLVISLSGCTVIVQLAIVLEQTRLVKWLRVIGYHSLYIYLIHLMLIASVRIVLVKVLGVTSIPVILVLAIAVGVVVPIILYNLSTRIGAWWLFSLKKPEEEIKFYKHRHKELKIVKQ